MYLMSVYTLPEYYNVVVGTRHQLIKQAMENHISAVPLISHPLEALVILKQQIMFLLCLGHFEK